MFCLFRSLFETNRHDSSRDKVIFDADVTFFFVKVVFDDGQARADASYIVLHRFDGRSETWFYGLLFIGYAGALVTEANSVAAVKN